MPNKVQGRARYPEQAVPQRSAASSVAKNQNQPYRTLFRSPQLVKLSLFILIKKIRETDMVDKLNIKDRINEYIQDCKEKREDSGPLTKIVIALLVRSEERRVGKECRSWWT